MEYKEHRKAMIEEIERGECFACGNNFSKINIHHINGVHTDNFRENLIELCAMCHGLVHKGFKKAKRLPEETIEKILNIRKELLKKHYSGKDLEDRIKYERALACNRGMNKKICHFCNSRINLRLITPDFISKFDPENTKKIGIVLCKNCLKKE